MYQFIILCLSSPASKSHNIPGKAAFCYHSPSTQQTHSALHVNHLASAKALHFLFHPIFIKDFLQEHRLFAVRLHTTGRSSNTLHKCFICSLYLSRDNQL